MRGIGRAGAAFAAWRSRLTPTFSTIGLLVARLSLCAFATARGGPYDDLRLLRAYPAKARTWQRSSPTSRRPAVSVSIFRKKLSAVTADRPELEKLLATSREGDVVIIPAVDRLSRDTTDLLVIARELQKAGAGHRSLAEPIVDATSDFAEIVLAALGVAAKLERWRIMERTAVGRADAKAQAVKFGRRQQPIEIFRPPTQLRPQRLWRGPPRATSAPAGAVEPGAAFGAWPRRSFPSAFWYRRVSVV